MSPRSRLLLLLPATIFVVLLSSAAGAELFTVKVTGATFDPGKLTIRVGDTVEWQEGGGVHTVTAGRSPVDNTGVFLDVETGRPFDRPLADIPGLSNPVHTFHEAGEYWYFCLNEYEFPGLHDDEGVPAQIVVKALVPTATGSWGAVKALFQ